MLWNCDEDIALIVYAELYFGVRPTVPFQRAIGFVRRAYRAHYLGIPFEADRGYDSVDEEEEESGW